MSEGDIEEADEGGATRAFEELRGEITLLRRAIERLAAERAGDADRPDYSETLGIISQNLSGTAQRVDALVKSPALSLTPEETGRQIAAAGFTARKEDHRQFLAARQGLEDVAARLGRQLHSHTEAGEQRRRLWQIGLAGLVVGIVLWASLAGPIARTLPASWLLPERMAARSLHMPMREGGEHMMQVAVPDAVATPAADAQVVTTNIREALDACHKSVMRAKKAVWCVITIEAKPKSP